MKLAIHGGKPAIAKDFEFKIWPGVDKSDEKLVLASLRQNQHAFGPNCRALCDEFAAWNGNKYAMATNSGTSALHMCLNGCGVESGDEVVTTSLSWTSSASCILHQSAIPVFVDVDWETMHLDPKKIEAAITKKTKAILVVHYWGVSVDMAAIMKIAKKHKLKVIEDACQAHGAKHKGKNVGTIGDAAAFSLNQNKNHCGGEGGFFVSNNKEIFDQGKVLIAFSEMRPPEAGREYSPHGMGYMYRTSDLPAAFARAQLKKLPKTNAKAQKNWNHLHDGLKDLKHLVRPYTSKTRPTNGYAYVLRTDPDYIAKRGYEPGPFTEAVLKALNAEGLPGSRARWVLPAHTVFQAKNAFGKGAPWTSGHARKSVSYDLKQFPIANLCAETCIWLRVNTHRPPNGLKQVNAVVRAVRKVYEQIDSIEA